MKQKMRIPDRAVSPVIGVMLMLVVTIIIAAAVSAFAGGMADTGKKAPTASFECHISNDGTWGGSSFDLTCLGTSDGIPTKDVKLITSWRTTNRSTGETISGGETVTGPPSEGNENTHYDEDSPGVLSDVYHSPLGFGPGVGDWSQYGSYEVEQYFGNYTILPGTTMHNGAYGFNPDYGGYGISPDTRYEYTAGTGGSPGWYNSENETDAMMAILGREWYNLRPGDTVHVSLMHNPSGKLLFDRDVVVEG